VRTIARDGDEVVFSSRIDRRSVRGGKVSENHYRIRCDGLPHHVQCGIAFCTTSCTYKAENTVEGETASPDGKKSYWTREVSADGQEMRILAYADKAKTKLKSTQVLDRVK